VVEYCRITTEIAPSSCHYCFREYAYALSFLGHAHRENAEDLLENAEDAETDDETEDLRDQAALEREKMAEAFKKSNQAYRTFFRNPGGFQVDPYDFERVMRHFEIIEDYESALDSLSRFIFTYGRMDDALKDKVERLKVHYKRELQRQKEKNYQNTRRSGPVSGQDGNDDVPARRSIEHLDRSRERQ
jgi:hypothetical protein